MVFETKFILPVGHFSQIFSAELVHHDDILVRSVQVTEFI